MKRFATFFVFLVALASASRGQQVFNSSQELAFDRPESWAMKYFASVNLLTGLGAPRATRPGSIELGLEVTSVPTLSARERMVGFGGTKTEDLNRTSAFGRPRIRVGLPQEFALTVSYLPPVEVFDTETHLVALAVERRLHEGRRWRVGARLVGQYGTLGGDFTCSAEDVAAGGDRQRNPFGCEEPSKDEMTIRSASVEVSLAWVGRESSRVEPYVAIAGHQMDLDFQVDARYSGIVDRTLLLTDGSTLSLSAGARYRLRQKSLWTTELFYSPLDVVRPPDGSSSNDALFNIRTLLSVSFG